MRRVEYDVETELLRSLASHKPTGLLVILYREETSTRRTETGGTHTETTREIAQTWRLAVEPEPEEER